MDKQLKILIVDDDIELREIYAEIFCNSNFAVFEAGDGLEGLDIATRELPDVIFTGVIMPRMDGFTMMESLKKSVTTSNIPVVISSHMGREEDRQRANILGAKDFIVRNITTPAEVVKRINSLFLKTDQEYRIKIVPSELDAHKLATRLNFQQNYQCDNCKEELVLSVKLKNQNEKIMEAIFVCPECGLVVK